MSRRRANFLTVVSGTTAWLSGPFSLSPDASDGSLGGFVAASVGGLDLASAAGTDGS